MKSRRPVNSTVMQPISVPKCVVLQTTEGEHLGFVLLAIGDEARQGECVFMVLPANTSVWSTPLVQSLFARKDLGESSVEVTSGPLLSIHIKSTGLPDFLIELDAEGKGEWRELAPGTHCGHAAVAAAA